MRNYKLERLKKGETFFTSEKVNSMVTLIKSGQEIRRVQVQSVEKEGYWNGCFSGIRFFNVDNKVILEAGKINSTGKEYFIQDFKLESNERLIGLKSVTKEKGCARHWDLQFTIGSK